MSDIDVRGALSEAQPVDAARLAKIDQGETVQAGGPRYLAAVAPAFEDAERALRDRGVLGALVSPPAATVAFVVDSGTADDRRTVSRHGIDATIARAIGDIVLRDEARVSRVDLVSERDVALLAAQWAIDVKMSSPRLHRFRAAFVEEMNQRAADSAALKGAYLRFRSVRGTISTR